MVLNGKGSRAFCLFTELSRGYGQHSVEYIKKYAANTEFIDFLFMGAGDNFPDVRRSRNPRPKRRGKGVPAPPGGRGGGEPANFPAARSGAAPLRSLPHVSRTVGHAARPPMLA